MFGCRGALKISSKHFVVVIVLCFDDNSFNISVSKPAPDWNGTAVIDGEFKELKLSDFRGKYLVFFFYPLDL